ncbi:MAG: hypothetical protein ABFR95_09995 [Actinomycetota bacterium]
MLLRVRAVVAIALLAVVAGACTSNTTDTTVSPGSSITVTTLPDTSAPEPGEDTTTTTDAPKTNLTPPEYQIVDRVAGDGDGDTVIVLLDTASYDSITDLDLYDLIAEVVELFPPIAVVHVVDDPAAANIVGNPDASDSERQAVSDNYLARLDNGYKITYLGRFASSGTAVLGS